MSGSRSGVKEGMSRSGVKGKGSRSGSRSGEVLGAWGQESRGGVRSGGGYGGWGQGAHGFSGRRLEIKKRMFLSRTHDRIPFHSIPIHCIPYNSMFHPMPYFCM